MMTDVQKIVLSQHRLRKQLEELDVALVAAREKEAKEKAAAKEADKGKKRSTPKSVKGSPFMRFKELLSLLGYKSHESVYKLVQRDASFPKPRRIGPAGIAWMRAEVDEWIASRPVAEWAEHRKQES